MPKTLTKMQQQIVAKVLSISATEYVWCRQGEVHSINNLRERGLLKGDCWGQVQHRHLTDEIKSIFFSENKDVFMIENFHGEGWLIFEDQKLITRCRQTDNANRIVAALKLLRKEEQQCQSSKAA